MWLEQQKAALKRQDVQSVLAALHPHLEADDELDPEAPVRQCHRYLSNRRDQLNYQDAIARKLPIGSGEVESAHRYVVQQRLKRPGDWWSPNNAQSMLALRLNRANRQWGAYWARRKTAAGLTSVVG